MIITHEYPEKTTREEWSDLALTIHKYLVGLKELKKPKAGDTISSDSVCCVRTKGA